MDVDNLPYDAPDTEEFKKAWSRREDALILNISVSGGAILSLLAIGLLIETSSPFLFLLFLPAMIIVYLISAVLMMKYSVKMGKEIESHQIDKELRKEAGKEVLREQELEERYEKVENGE